MRDDLYNTFSDALETKLEAITSEPNANVHLARIAGELCAIGNFLSTKGDFDRAISIQQLKAELASLLPQE